MFVKWHSIRFVPFDERLCVSESFPEGVLDEQMRQACQYREQPLQIGQQPFQIALLCRGDSANVGRFERQQWSQTFVERRPEQREHRVVRRRFEFEFGDLRGQLGERTRERLPTVRVALIRRVVVVIVLRSLNTKRILKFGPISSHAPFLAFLHFHLVISKAYHQFFPG